MIKIFSDAKFEIREGFKHVLRREWSVGALLALGTKTDETMAGDTGNLSKACQIIAFYEMWANVQSMRAPLHMARGYIRFLYTC